MSSDFNWIKDNMQNINGINSLTKKVDWIMENSEADREKAINILRIIAVINSSKRDDMGDLSIYSSPKTASLAVAELQRRRSVKRRTERGGRKRGKSKRRRRR